MTGVQTCALPILGACHGAILLGEASGFARDDDLDRIAAIRDMCDGASWEECAELYGPEHATAAGEVVGSFFGKIFKAVKKPLAKFALPIARRAVSFIPGVGPVASMAMEAAEPSLQRMLLKKRHMPPAARQLTAPVVRRAPAARYRPPVATAVRIPPHRHFTGPPIPL